MSILKRRDFLVTGTATLGASFVSRSASSKTWRTVNEQNQPIVIDIRKMTPGQEVTLRLGRKPLSIRYRTDAEIAQSQRFPISELVDQFARNENLPDDAIATDQNRTIDDAGQWLVYLPICTHLGSVTLPSAPPFREEQNWINCPSHGGRFDAAGRVIAGPAPQNLKIPTAHFLSADLIKIWPDDPYALERKTREAHPSKW